MSKTRKALEAALDVLKKNAANIYTDPCKVIADIQAVLAEPEQEPVAFMFQHEETGRMQCVDAQQVDWGFEKANPRLKKIRPLYTSPNPREWQPIEIAPKDGRKIIVFYLNRNNLPRTVMASWLNEDQADEIDHDGIGLEAGWYERMDNHDDYSHMAIHEGEPTKWMPTPPPPKE